MPASLAIADFANDPVVPFCDDDAEPPAAAAAPLRRILAFVRGWSLDRERPEDIDAMRARLKCLGAELTVLADSGVWSFDDDASYSDRACGPTARDALLLGVKTRGDMVYVIDGKRVSRYPHTASAALSSTLAAALTSRPENV